MHNDIVYYPGQDLSKETSELGPADKTRLLCEEIVSVAKQLGIYNDEVALDGPQVLMFLENIKEQALAAPPFTAPQSELLHCLTEESCEVGSIVQKAYRFGPDSRNPANGRTNMQELVQEIGDFEAVVERLEASGLPISREDIEAAKQRKHRKLDFFLKHNPQRGKFTL